MKKSTILSLLLAASARLAFSSGSIIVGLEFDGDSSLSLVHDMTTSASGIEMGCSGLKLAHKYSWHSKGVRY